MNFIKKTSNDVVKYEAVTSTYKNNKNMQPDMHIMKSEMLWDLRMTRLPLQFHIVMKWTEEWKSRITDFQLSFYSPYIWNVPHAYAIQHLHT